MCKNVTHATNRIKNSEKIFPLNYLHCEINTIEKIFCRLKIRVEKYM